MQFVALYIYICICCVCASYTSQLLNASQNHSALVFEVPPNVMDIELTPWAWHSLATCLLL